MVDYTNSLIASLRGANTTPGANSSNPGFTYFNMSQPDANANANAAGASSVTPGATNLLMNQTDLNTSPLLNPGDSFGAGQNLNTTYNPYATSKYFDPQDPFKVGQDLNDLYGANALLDHRRYGGRYANELSTQGGRQRLGNDIGFAGQNTGQTGFYRPQDFNPLPGFENLNDPTVIKNYAAYFPDGNSYFIPDKVEADPYQFAYHGFTANSMSKPEQKAAFDAMYGGRMLVNNAGFNFGGAENLMRELLNAKSNPRHFTPDINRDVAYNQVLGKSAGLLAGFDVGRGDISYEQGHAIDMASMLQSQLDRTNDAVTSRQNSLRNLQNELANLRVDDLGNTETYNQKKAAYEGQMKSIQDALDFQLAAQRRAQENLNPYLNTVRTVTDPTKLSSAEVINLLRLNHIA